MKILCERCNKEFEIEDRIRVRGDGKRSDYEERTEEPRQVICPDCKEDADLNF